jgi:hypothetical protein
MTGAVDYDYDFRSGGGFHVSGVSSGGGFHTSGVSSNSGFVFGSASPFQFGFIEGSSLGNGEFNAEGGDSEMGAGCVESKGSKTRSKGSKGSKGSKVNRNNTF